MASMSNPNFCDTQSYESYESNSSTKPPKVMYGQRGLKRSVFMPRQMKSAPQLNVKNSNSEKTVNKAAESCHRLRVQSFQNQLAEAERTIANLMAENRTLQTLHQRQEVALQKYESANADLPKLLDSHAEEVRIWELKCRNLKNANKEMQERLPKKESLIFALTDQNKYFRQLNVSKYLEERYRLTQHLKNLEEELAAKTKVVGQAIWRLQAELRHLNQKLTMTQKKVRACVYDLEKSRLHASGMDKLEKMNFDSSKPETTTSKSTVLKENPILTEPSTAEDTDTPQTYESNSNRKLSNIQRRMNQQHLLIRRRVERGDGDANVMTAQQMPRSTSNISQSAVENSSIDIPLTESSCACSEYGENTTVATEDDETARMDENKKNSEKLKSMTELTVSDSQLSCMAPTTTTDGSGTEDDCQSIDIQKNTSNIKREISNLRSRINQDLNIRMMHKNFVYTDESDADNQINLNNKNITEIIDVVPPINLNPSPTLRANQLLATLKSYGENNEK